MVFTCQEFKVPITIKWDAGTWHWWSDPTMSHLEDLRETLGVSSPFLWSPVKTRLCSSPRPWEMTPQQPFLQALTQHRLEVPLYLLPYGKDFKTFSLEIQHLVGLCIMVIIFPETQPPYTPWLIGFGCLSCLASLGPDMPQAILTWLCLLLVISNDWIVALRCVP